MSDQEGVRWLALARSQIDHGDTRGAIETLRRVLTLAPADARAHALLALCLVDAKRLHAAEIEARLALTAAPDEPLPHRAMGIVLAARRKLREADEHLRQANALEPDDAGVHRALAQVASLRGDRPAALAALDHALALDPEDPQTLADLAEIALLAGDLATAERQAREALAIDPEHLDATVALGQVALRRGRVAAARELALAALGTDPESRGALHLLAAARARVNPFLGLWWRWNTWMSGLGERGSILVLVGGYACYRVASIVLKHGGHVRSAGIADGAWLGLVIYTWVGPAIFQRMIQREIGEVQLKRDF